MTTLARSAPALAIETFRAPDEGCLGYLVVDDASRTALGIDPRLDLVEQFEAATRRLDVRLQHVLDTHAHADHLSGVRRLAERTGAAVLAHAASKLRGPARRLTGGTSFALGTRTVEVIDAPGHTPDSLALLVDGHLFTGDALFVGGAGRTDFPGGSAAQLFETFRRFEALADATVVHPGHDYVGRAVTTIGEEKAENPLLRERDRDAFVSRLSGTSAPPVNMAAILRHNLGESGADIVTPREQHALQGRTPAPFLLDVRSPLEFESAHIETALNVPLEQLDARVDEIPEQADVVVVCRTGVRATIATEALTRAGRHARVLDGGVIAWRRAKLPLREGRKRLPVDRQVQLIVGTMVLIGVALGALVNPWFLALAAFFGAGLAFAGATGTCGLALVLMRMPWNRSSTPTLGAGASTCAAVSAAPCAAPTTPER
jgi:glyoxylase-like metal-dependent hydrolase (beta-lactamase superfamily II)/rhodanese-related sulfurtransferase